MSQRPNLAAWIVAAVLFASTPALAQFQSMSEPDSEWDAFVSSGSATPNSPIGPTTPEGGFSAPERVRFGEKLRERVLDQLCRQIKLKYDYNLPGDFNGTGAGLSRYLAQLPDGRLTIVDEERLSVGYGHGFSKVVSEAAGASVGLWVGGRIDGGSMVIRPLEGKATCKELDTLVDLRDIKTVLPFKAERITAMKVGELWRLPFSLTVGHTESIGDTLAENLNVSLSFNGTEAGAATLTIYRLSESQLRFRFRVDRVEIRTKGASVVQTAPAYEFASLGANILAKLIDHELARQLHRYTNVSLGFSNSRSQGKRVVLEYLVDPRDPAQAEAVAQALHGNFQSLVKMAWRMGTQQATSESTEEAYLKLMEEHNKDLGAAAFAAINEYSLNAKGTSFNLPVLTSQHWSKQRGEDTMTRYTDVQGHIHFERAEKSHNREYFSVPWVGPLAKNSVQRNVQVVTAARAGEEYGAPIVVYLQQHGFLRATESTVRGDAKQFSDLMTLAGTRGNGPNPRMAMPLAKDLPEPPVPERTYGANGSTSQENANRKGSIAFTLVFSQEGVKQLLASTNEDILKAYAAACDSQPAMRWLMTNGRIGEDGKITYDWQAARRAFPDEDNYHRTPDASLANLARVSAGLLADIAAARNAPDNKARSVALMTAFGGLGQSKLSHEEVLRVFVQLVDPMNMTADFVANVERSKKEPKLSSHYVLKRDRPDNELLRLAGEAKTRFAQPSVLVD